ncbi:aminotransferase class IV [Patulibacter sp.]|uniref:aminotransferase class IV n=1 Tax=Patulibacter sp. TaxID=1912859 RepID=UPI00272D5C99|nr:aminotransferase class IV [Patulibacter sp.]
MFRRRPEEPLIETVLIESGRVRLFDRHLVRLRRSGAAPKQVTAVRALAETWRRTAGRPTVVRFEVAARSGVASRARTPPSRDPVRLALVPGFDPGDGRRERKLADRTWAEEAEAAAAAAGADEPLLHDAAGLLGETSRASLFVVDATGRIRTPPVRGILPGVTREWAIGAAGAEEHPLTVDDLGAARAAFLTTAARGVVPVTSIDGRPLGSDDRVEELAAAWRALV